MGQNYEGGKPRAPSCHILRSKIIAIFVLQPPLTHAHITLAHVDDWVKSRRQALRRPDSMRSKYKPLKMKSVLAGEMRLAHDTYEERAAQPRLAITQEPKTSPKSRQ